MYAGAALHYVQLVRRGSGSTADDGGAAFVRAVAVQVARCVSMQRSTLTEVQRAAVAGYKFDSRVMRCLHALLDGMLCTLILLRVEALG